MNYFDLVRTFDSLNHKAIAENVARSDFEVFAKACEDVIHVPEVDNSWQMELIDDLNNDRKVPAIKLIRARTGMGLKEAKDCVDLLLGFKNTTITKVSLDFVERMEREGYRPTTRAIAESVLRNAHYYAAARTPAPTPAPALQPASLGELLRRSLPIQGQFASLVEANPDQVLVYVVRSSEYVEGVFANSESAERCAARMNDNREDYDSSYYVDQRVVQS